MCNKILIKKDVMTNMLQLVKMMMLKVLLKFQMWGDKQDQGNLFEAEDSWSCIAEDRFCADVSGDDDDTSYIDDEEDWHLDADKFCDGVFNDEDVWSCDDEDEFVYMEVTTMGDVPHDDRDMPYGRAF